MCASLAGRSNWHAPCRCCAWGSPRASSELRWLLLQQKSSGGAMLIRLLIPSQKEIVRLLICCRHACGAAGWTLSDETGQTKQKTGGWSMSIHDHASSERQSWICFFYGPGGQYIRTAEPLKMQTLTYCARINTAMVRMGGSTTARGEPANRHRTHGLHAHHTVEHMAIARASVSSTA